MLNLFTTITKIIGESLEEYDNKNLLEEVSSTAELVNLLSQISAADLISLVGNKSPVLMEDLLKYCNTYNNKELIKQYIKTHGLFSKNSVKTEKKKEALRKLESSYTNTYCGCGSPQPKFSC